MVPKENVVVSQPLHKTMENVLQPPDPLIRSLFTAFLGIGIGNMNAKNAGLRVRLQPWQINQWFDNALQAGIQSGLIQPPAQSMAGDFINAINQAAGNQPQVDDVLNKVLERIVVGQEQTMDLLKEVLTDRKG